MFADSYSDIMSSDNRRARPERGRTKTTLKVALLFLCGVLKDILMFLGCVTSAHTPVRVLSQLVYCKRFVPGTRALGFLPAQAALL